MEKMVLGKTCNIDGFTHKLIEDNEDRGLFEVDIPSFSIKPIILIYYKDLK
jgi:hypothetical protein